MKLWSEAIRWLVASGTSLGLIALAMTGCGGDSGSGVEGTGSGASSNGASGGSSSAATGPDLNLGGENSGGPDPDDPINTCAGELIEAKYLPLDMYIMLDKSGSMLNPIESDPNQTKWQAVSAALTDFVSDPQSAGLGVGLQVFPKADPRVPTECNSHQECAGFGECLIRACWPLQAGLLQQCLENAHCPSLFQTCVEYGECANDINYVCNRETTATCTANRGACIVPLSVCSRTDDCRPAIYEAPAAPIAELPGAEAGLVAVISGTEPDGLTPTGPALQGALQHASSWASDHPDHQVVAVLATDGLPTLYEQAGACVEITSQTYVQEIDAVVQLAADGRAAAPSISTFVIGVMGPNDVDGPTILNAIAQAGGSTEAFIVDTQGDVAAQFRDALNRIRGSRLACELAIPEPGAGMTLDFNQVNVTFDNGNGPATLFYVEEWSSCDPTTGGWYYDKLPSAGAPERIVVCPTTCAAFGEVEVGSVQIQLGCETRTPVK
ncbi:MAG TPA: vWA domain-containing protein [Polyangiaceae bacterium]|nr:vWA domain-containing protein [Polyangiaceae bacterium]